MFVILAKRSSARKARLSNSGRCLLVNRLEIISFSMKPEKKLALQQLRHWRVRKKVIGSCDRPRMSVKFTGKNIYVQFIDDSLGRTLASAGTKDKAANKEVKGANTANAIIVGKQAAVAALSVGIKCVVFDRGAAKYHGKVKALADAARAEGLSF